jgi:hypothetical protein
MGALIVLHGLFLLNCIKSQQVCYILVGQDPSHAYRVGLNAMNVVPIPESSTMEVTLPSVNGKDPDGDLDQRALVLDTKAVNVLRNKAVMMIKIPMPDRIFAANRVKPFREDILNHSDPAIVRNTDQSVMYGESLLLEYTQGGAFNLRNNGTKVQSSVAVGRWQVMAFYSWPATCGTHPDHSGGVNRLLETKAHKPVTLNLRNPYAPVVVDDAGAHTYGLRDSELVPPCIHDTKLEAPKLADDKKSYIAEAVVNIVTATETGCGPVIVLEP